MPRYHLHLHNQHYDAEDEQGHDFSDLASAHSKALEGIRDFIGHEAVSGKIDFRGRVDITDDRGTVLQTVPFRDAFELFGL